MSRDFTPQEMLEVEKRMITAGAGTYFDYMRHLTVTINGQTSPVYSEEEIMQREQYPLIGKLVNNFNDLHEVLSQIPGGLDYLKEEDQALQNYVQNGQGDQDSSLVKWFEGRLDEHFYYGEQNEELFLQSLEETAAKRSFMDQEQTSGLSVPLQKLAKDLDHFASEYDPYEYRDRVEDPEDHIRVMTTELLQGHVTEVKEYLTSFLEEDSSPEACFAARALLQRVNQASMAVQKEAAKKPALDAQIKTASAQKCKEVSASNAKVKETAPDR